MEEIKITPEESDMLLHGGENADSWEHRKEIVEGRQAMKIVEDMEVRGIKGTENVSNLDTHGGAENCALQEIQKKADMEEGLRELIMSAIKNATERKIRSDAVTIETLKALPEAIRVYLSLSEDVPDRFIEEIRSNKDNNIIVTSREDLDRLSRKLNEKIEEQKKALSGW